MAEDMGEDIADDIRATMAQLNAGETIERAPEPVVETAAETPAAETAPAERDDGRDEHGRFKAKTPQAEAVADPKSAPQQGAEAAATGTEPVAPPAKWEPQAKAAFMAAPPEVQKQILAHVEATEKANADWQPKAQTYEMIEQVIAPQRQVWAAQGMSEAQAIAGLVGAQQELDRDLPTGLATILNSYSGRQHPLQAMVGAAVALGFTRADWLAVAGAGQEQGEEGAYQPPAVDPRLNALVQEVQALKGTLTQRQQEEQRQAQLTIQQQIDEFARDPKHIYFENVKPQMAALMKAGQAPDLATAYEMATWAHPEVRKLIIAQDGAAKAAAEKAALAAKKAAGVSVVGSPGPGKAAPTQAQSNQPDDIRGDVRRTLAELRAS